MLDFQLKRSVSMAETRCSFSGAFSGGNAFGQVFPEDGVKGGIFLERGHLVKLPAAALVPGVKKPLEESVNAVIPLFGRIYHNEFAAGIKRKGSLLIPKPRILSFMVSLMFPKSYCARSAAFKVPRLTLSVMVIILLWRMAGRLSGPPPRRGV